MIITLFTTNFAKGHQEEASYVLIPNFNVWYDTSDNVTRTDVLIENRAVKQVVANFKTPRGTVVVDRHVWENTLEEYFY